MLLPHQVPQVLGAALQQHQAGRLAEAEAFYRQILAVQPRHPEALHLLGVIASQVGRNDVAVTLIGQAIEISPRDSAFHYNLGFALRELGRLEEAVAAYQRAAQLKPDYVLAHNNLGTALKELGRADAALAEFREAIRWDPRCVFAHNNVGNVLREQGHLEEAKAAYLQAIAHQPDYAEAHSNLGVILGEQGQLEAAVAEQLLALRLKPGVPETHYNLGVILSAQGRIEETIAEFRKALALRPNYPEGHYNLGLALAKLDRTDEAVAAYRQALLLKPDLAPACNNMGNALRELGEMEAAVAAYRRALEFQPEYPLAHSNLLLGLHALPNVDPAGLFEEHRLWDACYARPLVEQILPHSNDPTSDRRLRIGYVSADLRDHAVAYFLESLLAHHDATRVKVFCYADVATPDAYTARLQALVPHWRNIVSRTDAAVAELIRSDAIDILVDLGGHTAGNRLLVFAREPAPVQVTYLGYCGTTGLESMDYRLTDAEADPAGESEAWHTEKLLHLPGGAWCFRPSDEAPPVNPLPALQAGHVTFGCFNALLKINEPVCELWSRIFAQVPGARLLLKSAGLQNASARERMLAMLGRSGIAHDRVELLGRVPKVAAHLETYGRVDIALDTFPYHGTTTTCEALWMGVPVVTLAGQSHASRVGVSLLRHLGRPEWVASTAEDYVRIAVELSRDVSALATIHGALREQMRGSLLTDGARAAREIEEAYREIWQSWCARRKGCPA